MPSPVKTVAATVRLARRRQHVGAGGAFRVGQHAVFLHDERPAERHHHEHAQNAAGEGQHRNLVVVEVRRAVRREEDQRGNREHDAARDRLAGGADGLHDVVFENRRSAEFLQHRNRQHRDRNRRADGQAGTKPEVDRRCAEDQAENRADHDCFQGEFRGGLRGGNIGLKAWRRRDGGHMRGV